MWFTENDEKVANEMYGKVLMVGECAYWGGYTAAYEPFKNDTKYSFKSWKDVYIIGKTKCERYKKRNAIIRV